MGQVTISTKADTLAALRDLVKKSYIEEICTVRVGEVIREREEVYKKLRNQFESDKIVIRSSSKNEDAMANSNAGHYASVLNVNTDDVSEVYDAFTTVIDSYRTDGESEEELFEQQILVQRQSKNILLSGVIFTRDIIHNLPYYTITYDDNGSTDSVTSGAGGKTTWIAKNASREFLSDSFANLIGAVKEIEFIFDDIEALDIEFGIDSGNRIIIFQVRPLAAVIGKKSPLTDREFTDTKAYAKCNYLDTNHIISDMAFWNPAEIIGSNPRPLDYSLYRELITAKIWSEALIPMGYQEVSGELMQKVGNKPYISVNYTFDGLTPAGINAKLKDKLNDYYEEKLKKDKTAHDKIEFEIIFNSYDFSTKKSLEELKEKDFSKEEIEELSQALYEITRDAVCSYDDMVEKDRAALEEMTELRHEIRKSAPLTENNIMKLYKYVMELLESIKRSGTPQFSRQARCAFMARSFCRTLVERGYFSQGEMDSFMLSIPTVASEFERDFDKYSQGLMTREEFNSQYGHLRLGTYDIRTDCYRQMYFDVGKSTIRKNVREEKKAKTLDEKRLKKALDDAGLGIEPQKFIAFLVESTQNREYFKFEFTKSLSLMLEIIIRVGDLLGIAREDMSYLEIQDLLSYHSRDSYLQIINERRNLYHANSYLVLPDVIFSVGDIDVINIDDARPNFITNKIVEADIVDLDRHETTDITGKIVILTKADPGYDWIFTKDIAGFVTKYGGAASHMAIRCAEFGIPAAIGCGEKIYHQVARMERVLLDCENGRITKKIIQE